MGWSCCAGRRATCSGGWSTRPNTGALPAYAVAAALDDLLRDLDDVCDYLRDAVRAAQRGERSAERTRRLVSKSKAQRPTADELLRPFPVTCSRCRGPATAYPKGTFCPNCSPAWIESFMLYCLNDARRAVGLAALPSREAGHA